MSIILATGGFFSINLSALAQSQPVNASPGMCSCWCASSTEGALGPSVVSNFQTCATLCVGKRYGVVGCFPFDAGSITPENDGKCWTESECTNFAQGTSGEPEPGTFGGQNPNCVKTKLGEETGYCYSQPIGVNLNIPILGKTTVYGFHEYLALAYKFLLPAMSLIAVVMIMVGGLEYVVSAGNSKRVDKAKTRITNAVIGLIILMSAYAIASLLDPRLVNLMSLRVPLIKTVTLIDPNSFCEQLETHGFVVTPVAGDCGEKGVIQSINEKDGEQIQTNFKVGDSCDFSKCADGTGQACVTFNGVNSCMVCSDIGGALGARPAASDYLCSQIASRAEIQDKDEDHVYSCLITYTGVNSCASYTYDSEPYLNCPKIQEEADKLEDPCKAYEEVLVTLGAAGSLAVNLPSSNTYDSTGTFCQQDRCKVAEPKGFRGCKFTAGSLFGANTCTAQ